MNIPNDLSSLLEGLDPEQPASAFIEDPAWLEAPQISPQELAYLDTLVPEYLQELEDQSLIHDIPAIDIDVHALEPEINIDLDFDR